MWGEEKNIYKKTLTIYKKKYIINMLEYDHCAIASLGRHSGEAGRLSCRSTCVVHIVSGKDIRVA